MMLGCYVRKWRAAPQKLEEVFFSKEWPYLNNLCRARCSSTQSSSTKASNDAYLHYSDPQQEKVLLIKRKGGEKQDHTYKHQLSPATLLHYPSLTYRLHFGSINKPLWLFLFEA